MNRPWSFRGRTGRALLTAVLMVPLLQVVTSPASADTATLTVETTSYSATESVAGMPVSYISTVGVLQDGGAVTLTHTMPAGVKPLGGYGGADWVCQAPSEKSITCSTVAEAFPAGTTLPTVTYSGIVTTPGMTASTITTTSSSVASSGDVSVTDALMTAGTVPAAPTGVSISETAGTVAGGNPLTVQAATEVPPTVLLFGTTAEFATGHPEVLLPCKTDSAAACFTPETDGSHIASMPARPAPGAVEVMVVTLGVGASTSYTYNLESDLTGPPADSSGGVPSTDPGGAEPPAIMPAQVFGPLTLIPGEEGVPYSHTLASPPGVPVPQSWAVSGGTVPPGLRLNSVGQLSGIPSTAGDYVFDVLLNGFGGERDTLPVTVTIAARPVVTVSAADGQQGLSYSDQPSVEGGIAPFAWSIVAGALPAGLTVEPTTGLISGTPTVSGTFSATVAAVDAFGQRGTATFSLVIVPAPMVTFTPPTSGQVAVPYSYTLTATGNGPLAWAITDGDLPAGLTLDAATGLLSGTPTDTGSSTFTVTVTDANGFTADKEATLVIRPGVLVITVSADGKAQALTIPGQTVTYTVLAKNTGSVDLVGATFTNDLSGVLDEANDNGDVGAVYAGGATGAVAPAAVGLEWTGDLPAGASVRLSYSVTVKNPYQGDQLLFNTIRSSTPGSNCPEINREDPRCDSSVSVRRPGLSIAASTDVASATPGDVVSISVEVSGQYGAFPGAEFSLDLAGMTDDATYNNDGTATIGNVTATSSALTWTGDLAAGETAVITFSVTVATAPAGDNALTGTVESTSPDFVCGDGESADPCSVTVPIQLPALTITNTLGAAPELLGHWTFDEGTGSTGSDNASYDSELSHPATLTDGASWATGIQGGSALSLDGVGGSAETGVTVLDTSDSFSVAAAVKLNSLTGNQTVLSQEGSATSGFTLGLRDGRFGFRRVAADSTDDTGAATAVAAAPPAVNRWYRLLGVYDRTASTLSLYIDGQLQQTISAPEPLPSTGQLVIGRGQLDGATDFVDGTIDDVQVYRGVLTGGSPATAGATQEFSMTIANSGQTDYSFTDAAIDLTGALDDAVYNQGSAVARTYGTPVPVLIRYDPAEKRLLWTGDLPVGAVITVSATLSVNVPTTGDRLMTTTVSSSAAGSSCPIGGSTGPSICRAAAVVLVPELTITNSADVSTATPGAVVQYTVTVRNSGQSAYQGASFDESLAGILDDAIWTGDINASSGTPILDDHSVVESTLSWSGDLSAGASATITFLVTVEAGRGDRTLSGTITSPTPSSNCAPESTDPRCTSSIEVLDPELTLSASTDVVSATPGSLVHYTITATNTGETAYTGANVTVDLAGVLDDASYRSGSSSAGTVKTVDGVTTWKLNVEVGATATANLEFVVQDPTDGDLNLTATVASDAAGSTCPTGTTEPPCSASVPVLVPELTIEKTADVATVPVGGTVTFSITLSNTGPTDFETVDVADPLSGVLDDAFYNYDVVTSDSTGVLFDVATLSWASGPILSGESATITYSVTVRDPDTGDRLLTGAVRSTTAGSNCAPGSTDTRCASAVEVVDSGLTIELSSNMSTTAPDAPVTFTTTVTNTGPDVVVASFAELLGQVFDDADVSGEPTADGGNLNFDGVNLQWSGELQAGATATITVTVIVRGTDDGDDRLSAFVFGDGSNCPQIGADSRCGAEVLVARLMIDDTEDPNSVAPGESFRLTTTFTNTGQVPYAGISVIADTTDLRDDLAPTPGLTTRSGILTAADTSETWTGSIPVDGVITLYGNYTAISPAAGDGQIGRIWTTAAPGSNCPAGNDDHRCSLTIPVREPVTGLTVSQVADKSEVAPGDTVTYTLYVHNSGVADLNGISVSVELAGIRDDTMNVDQGTLFWGGDNLVWDGDLGPGQTVDLTYSVTLEDPNPGDNVLISALRASGSNCPPSTTDPSCSLAVPVLSPQLEIVTSVDRSSPVPGEDMTFSTTITNTGQTTYANANARIPLGGLSDDATLVVNDATSGVAEYDDTAVIWNGELGPGASATVTISASVKYAFGDGIMALLASSDSEGSNCADGSTDTRCTATATVVEAVYPLTYTITSDAAVAVAGGVVGFTVIVTNASDNGLSADFGVSLTDILDDATVDGGPLASSGEPSIESEELTWSGTIPDYASVSVFFSVTVKPELANGVLAGTVVSPEAGYHCHQGDSDPRCAVTVPIAALYISQQASNVAAAPGSTVTFTTTVTNTGQAPYQGISLALSDAVSDQTLGAGDPTASAGTFHRTAGGVSWFGTVPVGESVTISRSLLVRDPPAGDPQFTVAASTSAPGSNCPEFDSNPDCSAIVDIAQQGLTVDLFTNPAFVTPGGSVAYRITVTNSGTDTFGRATAQVNLSGLLDDAALNPDLLAEGASTDSVEFHNDTIFWHGDIEAGASAVITFSVSVNDPAEGDLALIIAVGTSGSFSNCPLGENRAACGSSVIVAIPELTITTVPDTPTSAEGAVVTYTVTAVNSGQTDYTGADFSIDASGPQTLNSTTNATTGGVSVNPFGLSWTGDLAVGAAVTVTFSSTVRNLSLYLQPAQLVVQSTVPGNNCGPETADARCVVTVPIAGLIILNSADVSTAAPTDVISYTTTLSSYGQAGYGGISISVDLAGAVDDATYNSDAAATSGRIRADPGGLTLTWTGDLAPGETVVLTASVTVNNPDTGDKSIVTVISTAAPGSNCPVAGGEPQCTAAVTALIPQLAIAVVADTSTSTPGSTISYTMIIENTGETDYLAATVTEDLSGILDRADYSHNESTTTGALLLNVDSLSWTGDLPVGGSAVVTFGVRVHDPFVGDQTMVTTVASDAIGSTCPNGSASQYCSSMVRVMLPELSISITSDPRVVIQGGTVGYTVVISNTGDTPYLEASVLTNLVEATDRAVYNNDASADAGSVEYIDSEVVWLGALEIGDTAVVTFSLTTGATIRGGALVARVGSAAAGSTCPIDQRCVIGVPIAVQQWGLTVSTTADTSTAIPGDEVGFTITLANTGDIAYTETTLTADLSDITDDATLTGTLMASAGLVRYTEPTLTWTGDIPIGGTVTITYAATVSDPDSGDGVLSATVLSAAARSTCSADATDPACTVTVQVLIADLQIVATADVETTIPGAVVTYTVTATNRGEVPAGAARVSTSLRAVLTNSAYNGDAQASINGEPDVNSGALDYGDTELTWTGDIGVGDVVSISYSVTVFDPDAGDKNMIATVWSDAAGSSCPTGTTNADCAVAVRVLLPELTISQSADSTTVAAGDTTTFTITAVNTGQADYASTAISEDLTAILDDADLASEPTASSGTVVMVGESLNWTGDLAVGASVTITFSVTASFPPPSDQLMSGRAVSDNQGSSCPTNGTDPACTAQVSVLIPELTIVKNVDRTEVVPGGTARYTITATNTGETDYPEASLSDLFGGLMDDAVYNEDAIASSGSVNYAPPALDWGGELAIGDSVTITYSVTVDAPSGGDLILANSVGSRSVGSTCPWLAESPEPPCATSTPVNNSTIGLSDLTETVELAGPADATVTRNGAVTMTIDSNSPAGYTVTVQGEADQLVSADSEITSTIPLSALLFRETGTTLFQSVTTDPQLVHDRFAPTAPDGDAVSSDYQMHLPYADPGTYTVTLEYLVTAQ